MSRMHTPNPTPALLSIYGSTLDGRVYILGTREGWQLLRQLAAQVQLSGSAKQEVGRLDKDGTATVTGYTVDLDRLREMEELIERITEGDEPIE